MTKRARKDRTASSSAHINHEISQLLELHLMIRQKSYTKLPLVLRRAVRVAYAAHFRVLMEFFHDGRPNDADWNRLPPEKPRDVKYSQITGAARNRFAGCWNKADLRRLRDADKLLAHLGEGRQARRRMRKEWGDDADWRLIRPKLVHFLTAITGNESEYPEAIEAARRARLK